MSDNKESKATQKCPPQSTLPVPVIIWQGTSDGILDPKPARLVLLYEYQLPKDATEWTAAPRYVLERADGKDAMNCPVYSRVPLNDLPVRFFEDIVKAFDKPM